MSPSRLPTPRAPTLPAMILLCPNMDQLGERKLQVLT
jgi:hypothetical protein